MFEQSNIFKSGKIGEDIIIKYLDLIKNEKVKLKSINKYFDVMTNNNIMYEIKTQYHTIKSGWAALEFQTFNKPSGIETTKSDIYIYLVPDLILNIFYIYEIETTKLKLYIDNNDLDFDVKQSVDDKDNINNKYIDKYYKISVDILKELSVFYYKIESKNEYYKSFNHFVYECKKIRKLVNKS